MLEYYYCPPGYCRCTKVESVSDVCSNIYYYDDDDLQCVCDRQGKKYMCMYIKYGTSINLSMVAVLPTNK